MKGTWKGSKSSSIVIRLGIGAGGLLSFCRQTIGKEIRCLHPTCQIDTSRPNGKLRLRCRGAPLRQRVNDGREACRRTDPLRVSVTMLSFVHSAAKRLDEATSQVGVRRDGS